ncbi:MAG: HlyD family secretion protein [Syntrophales bacterium]|jgi:membrane fusion protein (multidrug efflux system)
MAEAVNNKFNRKKIIIVFMLIAVFFATAWMFYSWYMRTYISTDDAYVTGRIHMVAPKISGTVAAIYVKDNQYVKVGDLLLVIKPEDYEVRVGQAYTTWEAEKSMQSEAVNQIELAEKQLAEAKFRVASASANLEIEKANLRKAELDIKRAEKLLKTQSVSQERYDQVRTSYDTARARLVAAEEGLNQARANTEVQSAAVRRAKASLSARASLVKQKDAMLQEAKLNMSYAKIYAPAEGYITKKSVEVGEQLRPGQPVMAVVPLYDVWVIANYKETQLTRVKPGQKVRIKVDTYPGYVYEGRVDSIMAGTGSVLSMFPPENATGSFVKVVQRIPVKIVLSNKIDHSHPLRAGMSVVPTIIID